MNETDRCVGASVALLVGHADGSESVLAIQRDDLPDIPYPNFWELLGGAAEEGEDIPDCVVREAWEEGGVELDPDSALWIVRYPLARDPGAYAGFVVMRADEATISSHFRLGDEGQACQIMPREEFLARDDVVPAHQGSLRAFMTGETTGIVEVDRVQRGADAVLSTAAF